MRAGSARTGREGSTLGGDRLGEQHGLGAPSGARTGRPALRRSRHRSRTSKIQLSVRAISGSNQGSASGWQPRRPAQHHIAEPCVPM
ncbi:hypothetical protein SMICM304S_08821 [Streptomyces microflavus]